MAVSDLSKTKNTISGYILWGIPALFVIGSLMHFVYAWSGNLTIVGIFAPVNESVWEHLKMTVWPILLWWLIGYLALSKKNPVSISQWLVSYTVAQIACPLTILAFFYTYTGAFGIDSLFLDIFSLFLGITVGQLLALHIYRKTIIKRNSFLFYFCLVILVILVTAFTVFTFMPPKIPLFMDFSTGKYGI